MRKRLVQLTVTCLGIAVLCRTANAQKTKCVDDPVIFTIYSSYNDPATLAPYAAAILPDGLGPYVNGQNGVSAALTTCNGTDDAVLSPGNSRAVGVNLQNAVDTTTQTPSWTNSVVRGGGISIWKLLYNYSAATATTTYSFTTGMGVFGVNSSTFYYRMENSSRDTSSTADSGSNNPCGTALVNVTHYPATSMAKEMWIVWPDSSGTNCTTGGMHSQVGTLFDSTKNAFTNVGQFTTPFYIVIQRP